MNCQDWQSGIVTSVSSRGQAEKNGVEVNWKMILINDQPYTKMNLMKAAQGRKRIFEVTFRTDLVKNRHE